MNVKYFFRTALLNTVITSCLLSTSQLYGAEIPQTNGHQICSLNFSKEIKERFPGADWISEVKGNELTTYSNFSETNGIVPMARFGESLLVFMDSNLKKSKGKYYVFSANAGHGNTLEHISTKHISTKPLEANPVETNKSDKKKITIDKDGATIISLPAMIDYLNTYVDNTLKSNTDTIKSKFAKLLLDILPKQTGIDSVLKRDPKFSFGFLEIFNAIFGSKTFIEINKIKESEHSGQFEILEFVDLNIKQDCTLKVVFTMTENGDDSIIQLRSMYPVFKDTQNLNGTPLNFIYSWYDILAHIIYLAKETYPTNIQDKSILESQKQAKEIVWNFLDNQLKYDMRMFYEDSMQKYTTVESIICYTNHLCGAILTDRSDFPLLFRNTKKTFKDETACNELNKKIIEILLSEPSDVFSVDEINFLKNFFFGNMDRCLTMMLTGYNIDLYKALMNSLPSPYIGSVSLKNINEQHFTEIFITGIPFLCRSLKGTEERKEGLKYIREALFKNIPIKEDLKSEEFALSKREVNMPLEVYELNKKGYGQYTTMLLLNHVISYRYPELALVADVKPSILKNIKKTKDVKSIPYAFFYFFTRTFMHIDWLKKAENKELKTNSLNEVKNSIADMKNVFLDKLVSLLEDLLDNRSINLKAKGEEIRGYLTRK